jgi:RsiW-degrading membrane proteinase PrsW (M82 family)
MTERFSLENLKDQWRQEGHSMKHIYPRLKTDYYKSLLEFSVLATISLSLVVTYFFHLSRYNAPGDILAAIVTIAFLTFGSCTWLFIKQGTWKASLNTPLEALAFRQKRATAEIKAKKWESKTLFWFPPIFIPLISFLFYEKGQFMENPLGVILGYCFIGVFTAILYWVWRRFPKHEKAYKEKMRRIDEIANSLREPV